MKARGLVNKSLIKPRIKELRRERKLRLARTFKFPIRTIFDPDHPLPTGFFEAGQLFFPTDGALSVPIVEYSSHESSTGMPHLVSELTGELVTQTYKNHDRLLAQVAAVPSHAPKP